VQRGGFINYKGTPVKGQELPRNLTRNAPRVNIPEGSTLILFDPDAPSGTYLHWLKNSKKTYVPYAPPTPPSGTHRYIFRVVEGTPQQIPSNRAPIDPNAILPGRVKEEVMFTSK